MHDPTPAPLLGTELTDDLDQYLLHGERQIRHLLQGLIAANALLSAHIGNGQSFLTALLQVDEADDSLIFDASPDATLTAEALHADEVLCVTRLANIRIQFALAGLSQIEHDGHLALRASLPKSVLRLQRRENYRLQVPLAHAAVCTLPAPTADGEPVPLRARVLDISTAGIAIQAPAGGAMWEVGTTLEDCSLKLPELEPIPLTLRVRSILLQTGAHGGEVLRIGCEFRALPRSADARIQRYIFSTERAQNAARRG